MKMIEFNDVTVRYEHGILALENLSFVINKGELVFLTGPSGAGKTTVMNLIFSRILPTSGHIFLNEEDITDLNRSQVPYLRKHIGFVFQDFRLLNEKTIFENMDLILTVLGYSKAERKTRVLNILSKVGLAHRRNAFPQQLSGGEQQRVAIARGVASDPLVLLADEPTGNLDPETAWDILETLRDINARGTTMLIATHDYDLISKIDTRVIHLKDGRVADETEYPDSLIRALNLRKTYFPHSDIEEGE